MSCEFTIPTDNNKCESLHCWFLIGLMDLTGYCIISGNSKLDSIKFRSGLSLSSTKNCFQKNYFNMLNFRD